MDGPGIKGGRRGAATWNGREKKTNSAYGGTLRFIIEWTKVKNEKLVVKTPQCDALGLKMGAEGSLYSR